MTSIEIREDFVMKSITRMFVFLLFTGLVLLPGCLKIHPQVERHGYGRSVSRASISSPTVYTAQQDRVFEFEKLIRWKSSYYKIDYYLMLALVQSESSGNPEAVSRANCRGLTQLSLPTARQYDQSLSYADLHDPEINLEIASRHMVRLQSLVRRYFPNASLMERVELLASAWNAGWSRVRDSRGVPNIGETQRFSRRVAYYYEKYRWGNNR